jgi:hypothetical protein
VLKHPSLEEYREANRRAKREARKKTAVPSDTAVSTDNTNNSIHNTLKVIAKRLDHVENQLQELVDETSAVNAQLGKHKLIW